MNYIYNNKNHQTINLDEVQSIKRDKENNDIDFYFKKTGECETWDFNSKKKWMKC